MSRVFRFMMIVAVLAALLPASTAGAQAVPNCVPFESDAVTHELYLICLPTARPWNGDLVIFAHGYVPINEPLSKFLEQLVLSDGNTIPAITTGLGYAFATTSYRKNGLAVREGVEDIGRLRAFFEQWVGPAGHVYVIGASEGGLVTTLAVEQQPDRYDGGLALCGPIGNFRSQINYWGDFRTLYDYFFPATRYPQLQIPFSPVDIDAATVWPSWPLLSQGIAAAVLSDAPARDQLLRTSRAPIDPADALSVVSTTVGILAYNVFATNEGLAQLGGQPFDNRSRWYTGSANDWRLNREVARFSASTAALIEISRYYQTSGRLSKPLVTLHTTGDPIVPYWHETLYTAKTLATGSFFKRINIPIVRYGHCTFTSTEALVGFAVLVLRAGHTPLAGVESVLPDAAALKDYEQLLEKYAPVDRQGAR